MKLSEQQKHFASLVPRLIDYIYAQNWACTFGDCYRDDRVTYGHPNSMHRKRLAIDLNFFDPSGAYVQESERLAPFGEYWLSLDPECTWGGMDDGNHFSMYATRHGMTF